MAIDLSVPNTIVLSESEIQNLPGFEALDCGPYCDTGDEFCSLGFHDPEAIEYRPQIELPSGWHCVGFITSYGGIFGAHQAEAANRLSLAATEPEPPNPNGAGKPESNRPRRVKHRPPRRGSGGTCPDAKRTRTSIVAQLRRVDAASQGLPRLSHIHFAHDRLGGYGNPNSEETSHRTGCQHTHSNIRNRHDPPAGIPAPCRPKLTPQSVSVCRCRGGSRTLPTVRNNRL